MGRYLILGALPAATLQTFVPRATLLALGDTPLAAVVTIALAVVLSICSTVGAFVALAFAGIFSSGALLAFLVFGRHLEIRGQGGRSGSKLSRTGTPRAASNSSRASTA
jgi:uncharacterized membrane protein YraQ (UPF0718 family)